MHRRFFLTTLAALAPLPALAEHGWERYDQAAPVYLVGEVTSIIWADPHPHLELAHRPARLPVDLHLRVPPQKEPVDVAALLRNAAVPVIGGEIWRVELPTLARLALWNVPRPKIKQVISVLGYPGPQLKDTKTVVAEILFIDGKAYPMRSGPA